MIIDGQHFEAIREEVQNLTGLESPVNFSVLDVFDLNQSQIELEIGVMIAEAEEYANGNVLPETQRKVVGAKRRRATVTSLINRAIEAQSSELPISSERSN